MPEKKHSKSIYEAVTGRCAAGRILRAARSVTRLFDEALRPAGLTITQLGLLSAIGRFEPSSISELAELMCNDRTTLSRNLKPLEAAGLVFRGTEGASRKRRLLLTTLGQQKLEEAYPLWQSVQDRIESEIEKGELDALYRGLRVFSSGKLAS